MYGAGMAEETDAVVRTAAAAGHRPDASRWWSLAVVCLVQVMVVLDTTVVTIALPTAQHTLGLTLSGRQWVVTAYTVAFAGSLLPGGRAGDLIGRRRALIIGAIGFAAASAAGGAAVDPAMLVAARAVQGAFAGLLAPATLALLAVTFPGGRERATAFSVFSTAAMSGAALGLIGGGILTQYADWRWCLYINAPIAAVAVAGAIWVLPGRAAGSTGARLDAAGALLGAAGIASLVLALGQAGSQGWTSGIVIGALIAAAILLGVFTAVESRAASPLLPLVVITSRQRAAAFASVAAISFGAFGMFLLTTFLLQTILGYSPVRAGLAFLPYVAANALTATQLTRRLLPRCSPALLITPGLLLMAASLLLLSRLTPDSSYPAIVLPGVILAGLAVGLIVAPAMSIATSGPQPGIASAFVSTCQQLGGSSGTALLNTIAATSTAAYLAAHAASERAATLHGDTTACLWGALILAATATGPAIFLRASRAA
jgi:EmrB/QacA subfamily drug resistance transporter